MADDGPEDRLYPPRPILAVSVAVFRQGRVLVGRRARPPMAGRFSLPGGVVEIGETLIEAALRELYEEVGVEAEIVGFNRHIEPIVREGGRVRAHFVIASFVGRWTRGEARVSPEIDAVAWIEPVRLGLAARHAGTGRGDRQRRADRERESLSLERATGFRRTPRARSDRSWAAHRVFASRAFDTSSKSAARSPFPTSREGGGALQPGRA